MPRSTRPPRSPTPCCSRATCSTPTAPRRRRTGCGGSSACSPRPASPTSRTAPAPRCLLERRPGAVLHLRLRFLQLRARSVHDTDGRPVDELVDGDDRQFPWEEGVPREVDAVFSVDEPGARASVRPSRVAGEHDGERVAGGRVERRCLPLTGRIVVTAEPLPGPTTSCGCASTSSTTPPAPTAPRARSRCGRRSSPRTPWSAVTAGAFLSATDPPEWALPADARAGQPAHLAGARRAARGAPDLLLSSRSSSPTTRSSPPRARRTCSTAPRSTRSSACARWCSPTRRRRRPGRRTRARRRSSTRWTPCRPRSGSACTARSAPCGRRLPRCPG